MFDDGQSSIMDLGMMNQAINISKDKSVGHGTSTNGEADVELEIEGAGPEGEAKGDARDDMDQTFNQQLNKALQSKENFGQRRENDAM